MQSAKTCKTDFFTASDARATTMPICVQFLGNFLRPRDITVLEGIEGFSDW